MADNERLLKNLYSAVEEPLFLGDRTGHGQFGCLMRPGFFVSPNLTEADSSEDMAIVASLTNELIDTQCYYEPQLGSVSGWYNNIIEQAALPYKPLTPSEERELGLIRQFLIDKKPIYDYYKRQYEAADEAYEAEAKSQYPSGAELRRLRQLKIDRMQEWVSFGQKREVENRRGRYNYITRQDPSSYWNDLRSGMLEHERVAPKRGKYHQTFLNPSISEWPRASWTNYRKEIKESDQYNYSKSVNWSGGASYGWGLFNSISAGASGEKRVETEHSEASTLLVNFDYTRVKIFRPWLDENVFTLSNWTWKNTFSVDKYYLLSDGGSLLTDPPIRPRGIMPVLVTDFLVVKNVELTASWSVRDRSMISSRISGSASAGIGFFSVSGSYSEATREEHVRARFDGVTLKIVEPQVIGLAGKLLPRCPNPDNGLPWQGDETLPTSHVYDLEESAREQHQLNTRNDLRDVAYGKVQELAARHRHAYDRDIEDVLRKLSDQDSEEARVSS